MPAVFFITHPDVVIKPSVPVPDWPLNERGRARMRAMGAAFWVKEVRSIFASSERKARDGAQILADGLGTDAARIYQQATVMLSKHLYMRMPAG
jgi:broad specificity phosphatase PhoE